MYRAKILEINQVKQRSAVRTEPHALRALKYIPPIMARRKVVHGPVLRGLVKTWYNMHKNV
jgi:hypothetical protein